MGEARAVEKENVVIQAGRCVVTLLPRLGGKIASILIGNTEILQQPLAPYGPRNPHMAFDQADASGWDECLPSVAACRVANGRGMVTVPDHGDLWRVEWRPVAADAQSVTHRAECFSLPLRLDRTLNLAESAQGWEIRLDYTVTNLGSAPTPWSWVAHPLFAAEAGDRILLPSSIRSLRLEGSAGSRLGNRGQIVPWPLANLPDGSQVDLRVVVGSESRIGDKLFAGPLSPTENWCALERPKAGIRITARMNVEATPSLGLWICYGGWPDRPGPKQMCVALEPSTAPVDSLAETGPWSLELAPGTRFSWSMHVGIETI